MIHWKVNWLLFANVDYMCVQLHTYIYINIENKIDFIDSLSIESIIFTLYDVLVVALFI